MNPVISSCPRQCWGNAAGNREIATENRGKSTLAEKKIVLSRKPYLIAKWGIALSPFKQLLLSYLHSIDISEIMQRQCTTGKEDFILIQMPPCTHIIVCRHQCCVRGSPSPFISWVLSFSALESTVLISADVFGLVPARESAKNLIGCGVKSTAAVCSCG